MIGSGGVGPGVVFGQPPGPHTDRYAPIAAWRALLASERGKDVARQRGALSQLANARQKQTQGLRQFLVRGVPKVLNVTRLRT